MVMVVVHDKVTVMVLGSLSWPLRLALTDLEERNGGDRITGNSLGRSSGEGVEEKRVADPLRHRRRLGAHLRC
jgi:hypothetical protein